MQSHVRTSATAIGVIAASLAAGIAAPAIAQERRTERILLHSQALSSSLDRISRAAKVQIRFDRGETSRMQARMVDAETPAQAIEQAVAGTGMIVEGDATRGFRVGRPGDSGEIFVTARRDEAEISYGVSRTSSSTRDGQDLRSQPQSTTVITSKLLADQQVQTIADALRNASGTATIRGNVQGPVTFTSRGFLVRPLSGGLSDPQALTAGLATVERIEVLKGPAALLSGSDNLGGTANVVFKKPTAENLLNLTAEYGSYDDRRFIVDGSKALNADRTVSARLIAQHARGGETFAGYEGRYENVIYPSLRYRDSFFDGTIGVQATDSRQPRPAIAAFTAAGQLVDLTDSPIGDRAQGIGVESLRAFFDTTTEVADWLTIVSRGQRSESQTTFQIYGLAAVTPTQALFLRTNERQTMLSYSTDNYARFKFGTFGLSHTVSVGFNYSNTRLSSLGTMAPGSQVVVSNFFASPRPTLPFPAFGPYNLNNYTSHSEQIGYYAQDLMEYGPLHILAAVRRTNFTSRTDIPDRARTADSKASATTPTLGIVLDVAKPVSLYVNAMRGFIPTFLLGRDNEQLPPRRSTNIEIGAKFSLPRNLLVATLSGYRLRETNTTILIPGLVNRYDTVAGQQVKGVELDATLQPLPYWQIVGTYSYAEYERLRPTVANAVVAGQPSHNFSLFSKISVPKGPLRDLGASLGVYGFSQSFASQNGRYVLPGQTEVDANLYYRFGKVTANLGVTNLLNDRLYGVTTAQTSVPRREPRMFRLTLEYSFF